MKNQEQKTDLLNKHVLDSMKLSHPTLETEVLNKESQALVQGSDVEEGAETAQNPDHHVRALKRLEEEIDLTEEGHVMWPLLRALLLERQALKAIDHSHGPGSHDLYVAYGSAVKAADEALENFVKP
jgi:hypothetical protein